MAEKSIDTNSKETQAVKVTGRTTHHSYDLKVRIEDISFGAALKIWFYGLLISAFVFLTIAFFTGSLFSLVTGR